MRDHEVLKWVIVMHRRFGQQVYDTETSRWWTWEQALLREIHGPAWKEKRLRPYNADDANVMSAWLKGEFPSWMRPPAEQLELFEESNGKES